MHRAEWFRSSVWILFHVRYLAPELWRWLLNLWKICVSLVYSTMQYRKWDIKYVYKAWVFRGNINRTTTSELVFILYSMLVVSRLLRSWVRFPPGTWMFFCCECCVLSGRGLCDELITCPEESYRLWCVVVCDLETSWMRRPWPALGRSATEKNICSMFVTALFFLSLVCNWRFPFFLEGRKNYVIFLKIWTTIIQF